MTLTDADMLEVGTAEQVLGTVGMATRLYPQFESRTPEQRAADDAWWVERDQRNAAAIAEWKALTPEDQQRRRDESAKWWASILPELQP